MEERIPFIPFSLSIAKSVAKPFYGIGEKIEKFFPGFNARLIQARIKVNPREYFSIAFFCLWFWSLFIFFLLFFLSIFLQVEGFLSIAAGVSIAIGFLSFSYIILYPGLLISRRVRDLERNLLSSLRHLLVQIRSGVPLFDGLVSVSERDYGLVSREFKECVKSISAGTSETEALEDLIFKNPSIYFRRVIWQLTNAIRSGANLSDTLEAIVESLSAEQRVAIRKYGSQLNPLSMMYMMTAVILPSLGITFLILLSSFSGILISESLFWVILAFLFIFQVMFIGVVKNRRPSI